MSVGCWIESQTVPRSFQQGLLRGQQRNGLAGPADPKSFFEQKKPEDPHSRLSTFLNSAPSSSSS